MSLKRCIPDMVKRGELDPARAKRMEALFDELDLHYRKTMAPDAAAAEASEATLRQLKSQALQKKRQLVLQANRQREAIRDLATFKGGTSFAAIRGMLDRNTNAPYSNITVRADRIRNQTHAMLREFIERHRRGFNGKPKDREGLRNAVREVLGEETGDVRAKTAAGAVSETFEFLRQRFNAAGGAIGKLDRWFPQRWSPLRVRKVDRDTFISTMMPELDRARMIDRDTGVAMSDEKLTAMLGEIHQTIRADGLTGEPTSAYRGAGKLADGRNDHRVLHFKDADSWLRANDAFGSERDPFTAIMGHINGMAEDIAMLERFGPNPDATMRLLMDHVAKDAAAKPDVSALAKAFGGKDYTEQMWRFVKGEGRQLVPSDSLMRGPPMWFARGFAGLKNFTTATKLGSAPLSAISDVNTQLMTRHFNGLPSIGTAMGYLRQLNPLSATDRRLAIELELGMRDASQSLSSLHRWGIDSDRAGWTAVVADDVLRASGLNKITEAGQRDYGMTALRELASHRDKDWIALPAKLREGLERYGIGKTDWPDIRYSDTVKSRGREYVKASNLTSQKTGDKVMDWVLGETSSAVQEASLSVRMAVNTGAPGTWKGMLGETVSQFKAFGVGLMMDHGRRAMALGWPRGAAYMAELFVGMTTFGALSIQLREIAKGKDPRPMNDAEFWIDAVLQGGAFGIVGDVIGTFDNDRLSIEGVGGLFAGPMVGTIDELVKAGLMALPGQEREDGTRREANPVGAALFLAQREAPWASLWYTRAAWEQLVIDNLAAANDDAYWSRKGKQTQRDEKNRQGRWMAEGEPLRAPDFANALGGEE